MQQQEQNQITLEQALAKIAALEAKMPRQKAQRGDITISKNNNVGVSRGAGKGWDITMSHADWDMIFSNQDKIKAKIKQLIGV